MSKKLVPNIRFKGFEGEWKESLLNEKLIPSREKNTQEVFSKDDVLSVSGDYGVVNQLKFKGRSFAGVSVAPYGVVHTNDVVYTKSPLKKQPYGIIKTNKGVDGIVSTLYAIYSCAKGVFPNFIEDYFNSDERLNSYLRPLVRKGAKNDMKISLEGALAGKVWFPEYEEQKMISTFFEILASMEHRGVISIECFDALFGYIFFIAYNNKDVKEIALEPYSDYYTMVHTLAPRWEKYRRRKGLPIPLSD